MIDKTELEKMDKEGLEQKVAQLRRQLFDLKLEKATTGLEKPHQVKDMKKDVARCLTMLNSKSRKQ